MSLKVLQSNFNYTINYNEPFSYTIQGWVVNANLLALYQNNFGIVYYSNQQKNTNISNGIVYYTNENDTITITQ